jgi:hypothetical protein
MAIFERRSKQYWFDKREMLNHDLIANKLLISNVAAIEGGEDGRRQLNAVMKMYLSREIEIIELMEEGRTLLSPTRLFLEVDGDEELAQFIDNCFWENSDIPVIFKDINVALEEVRLKINDVLNCTSDELMMEEMTLLFRVTRLRDLLSRLPSNMLQVVESFIRE